MNDNTWPKKGDTVATLARSWDGLQQVLSWSHGIVMLVAPTAFTIHYRSGDMRIIQRNGGVIWRLVKGG